MSTKSYLDTVIYISQDGKKIDNFIVSAKVILEAINLVKALLKKLDSNPDTKCPMCRDMSIKLDALDKQLAKLYEQPKLKHHEQEN